MTHEPTSENDSRILVVCTANVCRSPYIERRLAQLLTRLPVRVTSRGTRALAGEAMDPQVMAALREHESDTTEFTSRPLTPSDVEEADLIITAAREHRAEVVRLDPRAMARCFTLLDLADLAGASNATSYGPLPPGTSWVQHATARLAARRGLVPPRPANDADVADPTGLGVRAYNRMVNEVESALPPVAAALTPLGPVTSRRR